MSYINLEYIEARTREGLLREITNLGSGAGVINSNIINSIIDDADAIINTYLGKRYQIPVITPEYVVRMVQEISFDIVIYKLHKVSKQDVPQDVSMSYHEKIEMLKSISSGITILPGAPMNKTVAIVSNKSSTDVIFNRTKQNEFNGTKGY